MANARMLRGSPANTNTRGLLMFRESILP